MLDLIDANGFDERGDGDRRARDGGNDGLGRVDVDERGGGASDGVRVRGELSSSSSSSSRRRRREKSSRAPGDAEEDV